MDYRIGRLVEANRVAERQFAFCESCFWSATIFEQFKIQPSLIFCPVCSTNNISLIPLANDSDKFPYGRLNGYRN